MKYSLVLVSLFLTSCASMRTTAFEQIHYGDSDEKLAQVMGQPDQFQGGVWVYHHTDEWQGVQEMCTFQIVDRKVVSRSCGVTGPGSFARGLAAAGQGLQSVNR